MKLRSLSRRVLTIVVSAQLLCAVLLSCFALFHERHTRLRAFDESIKGRSDSVLGAIQDAEDMEDSVTVDARELRVPRGDSYKVYSPAGVLLGGGEDNGSSDLRLALRAQDGFFDQQVEKETYRVYQRSGLRIIDRGETDGVGRSHPVIIQYAASKAHLEHEILEAAGVYTFIILLVILGTGALVIVFVRRALSPLQELAYAAAQISAPTLLFQTPRRVEELRELKPLADVLHHVLETLREAFAKERRFVGDAAHELKTAIAVVRSTVQVLMLKRRTAEEYSAGLTRVVEDIGRVEALVAQMLSSSVPEAHERGVVSPLALSAVIGSVLEALAPLAAQRQVVLESDCQAAAMVFLREEKALALVSNLVLNAIQHSEPGMLVTTAARRTDDCGVILEVKDTGHGIGEAALPHVFERFYREDRSRSRDTGGAGLGLAICESIVLAAGGTIRIGSRIGLGTTVTVTFMAA